jgi:FkbM family methyltransferase
MRAVPSELRLRITSGLSRVPGVRHPKVRRAAVVSRREVRRTRRLAGERLGRTSLSRPAEHDLDRQLERFLPNRDGYFVEAGANDGYEQSNTYFLERFRGWRGVLIEPIPELYKLCVRERPHSQVFNCALVAPADEGTEVTMHYGWLRSVVAGAWGSDEADEAWARAGDMGGWDEYYQLSVPGRTLSSVLDEAALPRIDLVSLDVEGYEAPVLEGLDLDHHAPKYLLIEMRQMGEMRPAIERRIGTHYEPVEPLSPYDMLYGRSR